MNKVYTNLRVMLPSRGLFLAYQTRLLLPKVIFSHTALCPTKKTSCPPCASGGGAKGSKDGPSRALQSGQVRLAFIPEEWFKFFHSKTGVTGPYIFGLVLANYLVSKEKFIMEHEYYLGLSFIIVMAGVVKYLGPEMSKWLDHEVDAVQAEFDNSRKAEIDFHEDTIKTSKDAQWRAEGQKLLMDAKKENIAMQLEAIYRERAMLVYRNVKGRMDYHVKRYRAEARIHQKWMIGWILDNVRKSITPDFEKQALDAAIQELAAVAGRAK